MPKWTELKEQVIQVKIKDKVLTETVGAFDLANMTPEEMRIALRTSFAKYTYYVGIRSDVKRALSKTTTDYELWEAELMIELNDDPDTKKLTEKAKKAKIIADNADNWKDYMDKLRTGNHQADKLLAMVTGFELMIRAIMSVLSMMKTELELTAMDDGRSIKGKGRLKEQ